MSLNLTADKRSEPGHADSGALCSAVCVLEGGRGAEAPASSRLPLAQSRPLLSLGSNRSIFTAAPIWPQAYVAPALAQPCGCWGGAGVCVRDRTWFFQKGVTTLTIELNTFLGLSKRLWS